VERVATQINVLLSPQAARLLANVSAGLPRRAEQLLESLRNHFPNAEDDQLSVSQVREFLKDCDIDDKGLGAQEHRYLHYLRSVGSVSLESLAIFLGLDSDFVRRQIEPLLLREGLVRIGPGGRQLTPPGLDWINGQGQDAL
jgi:Holliday junction DNA helicase RuvB